MELVLIHTRTNLRKVLLPWLVTKVINIISGFFYSQTNQNDNYLYKGHLDMVKFLLEAGADQEHKTDEMHTALMEGKNYSNTFFYIFYSESKKIFSN